MQPLPTPTHSISLSFIVIFFLFFFSLSFSFLARRWAGHRAPSLDASLIDWNNYVKVRNKITYSIHTERIYQDLKSKCIQV